MKYRIVKRTRGTERYYYVIQSKGFIFRWWSDVDWDYYVNNYPMLEMAQKDLANYAELKEEVVWPRSE